MKKLVIKGLALVLLCMWSCTGGLPNRHPRSQTAGAESFELYDKDWQLRGHVVKGSFADWYRVYDENWELKGYIKRNDFSGRYELYDKRWKKKGSVLPRERR